MWHDWLYCDVWGTFTSKPIREKNKKSLVNPRHQGIQNKKSFAYTVYHLV